MLKKPRPQERGGAHEKIRAEKATRLRDERGAGGRKHPKSHATINSLNENSLDEEINNLLIRRDKQMSVYSRLRLQSEGQIAI